jgi:uncharacterized CHY-type Zn-finger protein
MSISPIIRIYCCRREREFRPLGQLVCCFVCIKTLFTHGVKWRPLELQKTLIVCGKNKAKLPMREKVQFELEIQGSCCEFRCMMHMT